MQGLSNYLLELYFDQQIKVVIVYDCCNNFDIFVWLVVEVFLVNGIYVYFFESLWFMLELLFVIWELGCQSGVMFMVFYNFKEYNGYKVYGVDGGQLIGLYDVNVIEYVCKIVSVDDIKFDGQDDFIEIIGKDMDEQYLEVIFKLFIFKEVIQCQYDLVIVFFFIYGMGGVLVLLVFECFGFINVQFVEE